MTFLTVISIPINIVRHVDPKKIQPICLANLRTVSKSKVTIRVVAFPVVGLYSRRVCSLPSTFLFPFPRATGAAATAPVSVLFPVPDWVWWMTSKPLQKGMYNSSLLNCKRLLKTYVRGMPYKRRTSNMLKQNRLPVYHKYKFL